MPQIGTEKKTEDFSLLIELFCVEHFYCSFVTFKGTKIEFLLSSAQPFQKTPK